MTSEKNDVISNSQCPFFHININKTKQAKLIEATVKDQVSNQNFTANKQTLTHEKAA